MVFTCMYCVVIRDTAPNVNKNCSPFLKEDADTVERGNNKELKGLLQFGLNSVSESSPVCDIQIVTGFHSLCTGDANLRYPSFFLPFLM